VLDEALVKVDAQVIVFLRKVVGEGGGTAAYV
jgi:hypothetical protein